MFPPWMDARDTPSGYEVHFAETIPLWLRIGSSVRWLQGRLRHRWIEGGYWWLYPEEDVADADRDPVPPGWVVRDHLDWTPIGDDNWFNFRAPDPD